MTTVHSAHSLPILVQMLSISVDSAAAPDEEPSNPTQERVRPREGLPNGGPTQRGVSVPAGDNGGIYVYTYVQKGQGARKKLPSKKMRFKFPPN